MINSVNLELISKVNSLIETALNGKDSFIDDTCNFLANELDLQAVVLFKTIGGEYLTLGRSTNARKNYIKGSKFSCDGCSSISNFNSPFAINTDSNCQLQISEFVIYEGCSSFQVGINESILIKIAKKTAFSNSDKDSLFDLLTLLKSHIAIWLNIKGGSIQINDLPFNKLVLDSSHELRNLTNSIIGFISLLAEENLANSNNDYLSTIKRNAQTLLMNINDLSDLAKIETGTISKNIKLSNVCEVINEVTEIFRNKLKSGNIQFNLSLADAINTKFQLEEQKLRYILINLLQLNIVMTQRGEINIDASLSKDNHIKITISDNGKGISQDLLPKLFEPFAITKVEESKSTTVSGLTLTLLKKYVESLGGNITVSKSESGGLTFSFTLSSGIANNSIENTLSQLPKPTLHNQVLVIEEDYATSKLMSNYLNKWGYNPTLVNSEEQALTLINKEQFLAIILDIEISSSNGLELLKKLHEHPNSKNIPVIVCSVEPEQQKAFMMGAVEYFIKPINYNFLVEVLTSYKLKKDSNVLCVDDDLPTLNLVKKAIESAGFNAIAENISSNVMEIISDKDIDLAIVDLDMPTPNGFELIKLIKSEKKFAHLPIIIYTGKENYAEDLKSIEGLFSDLLDKKSTNIEDLADTINMMINRYDSPPPVEDVIQKDDNVIKILLAEDYKHSQIIVTRLLKKNGFENIVVVENGEAALEMSKKENFSLILMDMQMPIMNGFEATEKIRKLPEYKDTPIIALTAFAMKGDREKCLESGATDYIPKPIDSKDFIEKVKYYTNKL
ncbi:hypothetical protein APF79_07525 [bacterium BRH_c32]|nr:MAG: hypothetical protein APF79_07525 [bacterium BRH_c32]